MKKSLSNSGSEAGVSDTTPAGDDEVFEGEEDETLVVVVESFAEDVTDGNEGQKEPEEFQIEAEEQVAREDEQREKSESPDTASNATENVLYQEIPMVRPKRNSPPQSLDDYAEPQLMVTSPQPSTHSSITSSSSCAIPISTNGSPLYAQVHKEPRTEIQKIHSTIPNTFKNDSCMLTTFGTKTPSMTSFGTPMSSLGAGASGGVGQAGSRHQLLAASYSNDLNSSKDSMLGSLDMLSDSGNHSDSWMYPAAGGLGGAGGGLGGRKKARAPPSSFTDQLNQVLADRERCVGVEMVASNLLDSMLKIHTSAPISLLGNVWTGALVVERTLR